MQIGMYYGNPSDLVSYVLVVMRALLTYSAGACLVVVYSAVS